MGVLLAILIALVVLAVVGWFAVKLLFYVALALLVVWLIGVVARGTRFGRRGASA